MILTCHEETTDDDGMLAPCGEHAVAYRYDPEHIDRAPYPVCVEHVRAPMAVVRRSDDVKLDALVGFAVKVHTRGWIVREDLRVLGRAGIELVL